jgi:hypothetical protein
MRQHGLFRMPRMLGDVSEELHADLRFQAFVPKDFADEPHQLALQYAAAQRRAVGRPVGRVPNGRGRIGN